jgi:serine/threonine protein kinase
MPYFPSTLEYIPKLTKDIGSKLFTQISDALIFIHSLGYNHMDVKPSNICVRETGDFVLIDIGSMAKFWEFSSSTSPYVPPDFQPRVGRFESNNRFQADDKGKIDWLMLAMTIVEKVYEVPIGVGATPSPNTHVLMDKLTPDFPDLVNLIQQS